MVESDHQLFSSSDDFLSLVSAASSMNAPVVIDAVTVDLVISFHFSYELHPIYLAGNPNNHNDSSFSHNWHKREVLLNILFVSICNLGNLRIICQYYELVFLLLRSLLIFNLPSREFLWDLLVLRVGLHEVELGYTITCICK